MGDDPARQRVGRAHQRIKRFQFQNMTRIDGVRVADKPLNLSDRKLARAGLDRRARGGQRARYSYRSKKARALKRVP